MHLYEKQFSGDLDQPRSAGPTCTVLIASTPRCGSHMLGHAMTGTGVLGVPFEYTNPANLAEWSRRLATVSPKETIRTLMTRRTTANGVFAIKAHFSHCESLGSAAEFLDFWPNLKVVHLCRPDVLRQAISYAVARQTGVWIAGQEAEQDHADCDPQLIAECLDDIAVQNARWISAFAAAGITPLSVRYEDAIDNLQALVTGVARHVGAPGTEDLPKVTATTRRQGISARTEDWVRRYAEEKRRTRWQASWFGRITRAGRS